MSRRGSTLLSPEKRRAEQKRRAAKEVAERHGEDFEDDPEIDGASLPAEDAAEASEGTEITEKSVAAPDPEPGPAAASAPAPQAQAEIPAESPAVADSPASGSRSRMPLLVLALAVVLGGGFFVIAPGVVENGKNKITPHAPYEISPAAASLHAKLVVGDLHGDSLLWARNLNARSKRGHMDLPRLAEGNVALQVFSAVTSVPKNLNYEKNSAGSDSITMLAVVQLWPSATWGSVLERGLYQSDRLHELAQRSTGALRVIRNRGDAEALLTARAEGQAVTGGILSFEGAQVLEGDATNVQRLYDAGYRVMGLLHFFDNAVGGSLHGEAKEGLTPFGRQAVAEMVRLGVIIDLAHSSEAVVRDVLTIRNAKRLIISHTGVKGACDTPRNIPDALMKRVAARGGLIGIGFWDAAVCDISPAGVVKSIRYAVNLVGVDHVALGSDFDGATTTAFDTSELAALTHEMLKAGFSEIEIRLVMGGNLAGFFLQHLPN